MSKSVLDLQNDCLNHSIPCSQLLLKAYAIARKLKNEQMAVFCKKELNGYEDNPSGVPNYRVINISLEVQHGPVWQTVIVPNNSYLLKYNVTQSVKELETLCSQGKNYYTAKLSSEELIHLRSVCQNANILDGHKKIPAYHFDGIIYKVRHILLEWALKLGDDGIWGDNLEFRVPLKITPKPLFTNKLTFTIFNLVTKRGFLYGPAQLFRPERQT